MSNKDFPVKKGKMMSHFLGAPVDLSKKTLGGLDDDEDDVTLPTLGRLAYPSAAGLPMIVLAGRGRYGSAVSSDDDVVPVIVIV
jgi:hypothetical protein